jgi:hypothetical protein
VNDPRHEALPARSDFEFWCESAQRVDVDRRDDEFDRIAEQTLGGDRLF